MHDIEILDLELVGGCNYRCRMCPHTDPGREQSFVKTLPWPVFEKIIKEAHELGIGTVRLHGSGEPTLYRRLPEAVAFCKAHGMRTLVTTNGERLTNDLSQALIDAGLDQLTVSATGYDRETYRQWMGTDRFDLVRDQVRFYASRTGNLCNLYHLIIDPNQIDHEVTSYKKNWIEYTGAAYEIWHMHNWSGMYSTVWDRTVNQQRSCGRMFQPVLVVRAGGLDGRHGAVVACCMVLGKDSSAVLGYLDSESIQDVWNGAAYQRLRDQHAQGRWNEIDYCRSCDQLYDRPESLVATNLPGRVYKMIKSVPV